VFDLSAPKILRYSGADMRFESSILPASMTAPIINSGELTWAGIQPSGAVLLYPGWQHVPTEEQELFRGVILRLAPGAERPDTLVATTFPTVSVGKFRGRPVPGWARPVAAVGVDGRLAVGGYDQSYRILVYDSDGAILHQICGAGEPLPVSSAEGGQAVPEGMEALAAAFQDAALPAQPAPYGRLTLAADGFLWVQRDRGLPFPEVGAFHGRAGALYDVFDPAGRQVLQARLPAHAYLAAALGDTIWTFEFGQFDEVEVAAYERRRDRGLQQAR
jgi:hypothetical protein